MTYIGAPLVPSIRLTRLYSLHYFEYARNFSFAGETHNFWEFIYVDSGDVQIMQGSHSIHLEKKQIAFHQPGEFHNVHATGQSAPNLIVIAFDCHGKLMNTFREKVYNVDPIEKTMLASIISEAKKCISSPMDDPYLENICFSASYPIGALQMISNYIELFLLHLCRRYSNVSSYPSANPVQSTMNLNEQEIQYTHIQEYLQAHIDQHLSVRKICHDNMISRSQLYNLYSNRAGCGVIDVFNQIKMKEARRMIRESNLHFQQIAEQLGFSSLPYFSRLFKQICGKTPSEYATSVKALAERK